MVRKLILSLALIGCSSVYAFAAERATFILTNGERKSGDVVFHGGQANNMIDGQLNLGNNGQEQSYPVDQVAVIAFDAGTPSQTELSRLPASGQMVVMRNGQIENGTFVNMRHGDTLIWKNESGATAQYPLSDVARVYLNAQGAKMAYNYTGPTETVATPAQSAQTTLEPGAVRVNANQGWTSTGVIVQAGDLVTFRATGQIQIVPSGQAVGPDGQGGMNSLRYPVKVMLGGGLIGKVGNSAPFPIGSNTAPIRMPANGMLLLGVNDDQLGDNSGFFSVVVQKTGRKQ